MKNLTAEEKYKLQVELSQLEGDAATMRRCLRENTNDFTQWVQNQTVADSYHRLKEHIAKIGVRIEPFLQSIEVEIRR